MKHSLKRKTFAVLAFVLSAVMVITSLAVFAQDAAPTVWDGSIATSFEGGEGTANDPYQIATAEQLAYLASLINTAAEMYDNGDGMALTNNEGSVHMYTINGVTYYLSSFNGVDYLSSTNSETSYTLAEGYKSATVYRVTIGGVQYYCLAQPVNGTPAQAYEYDTETFQMTAVEGVSIAYRKFRSTNNNRDQVHYYIDGSDYPTDEMDHTAIASAKYSSLTTISGHTAQYVNDDGQPQTDYLLSHSSLFTKSETIWVSALKDDVLYGWMPGAEARASAVATTDANGNKFVVYGEQLLETKACATLSYILTADIVLNDTAAYETWSSTAPANAWTPIGDESVMPFSGTFDGDGYTIFGLYICRKNVVDYYNGLFGTLKDATVKNVTLEKGYVQAGLATGALAGQSINSKISGVTNESVYVRAYKGRDSNTWYHETMYPRAGGIVGAAKSGTEIFDCHCNAKVVAINDSNSSGSGTLDAYAGGIVGEATGASDNYVNVFNCTVGSTVQSWIGHHARTIYLGGVVAYASYTNVAGCVSKAKIERHYVGSANIGGVVGYAANSKITSNVSFADIHDYLSLNGGNASDNGPSHGGILSYATSSTVYVTNNIFAGKQATNPDKADKFKTLGMIIGNVASDNANIQISYNYYVLNTESDLQAPALSDNVSAKTKVKKLENFEITEAHLKGTASAVINADSTYANTADLVSAMNAYVVAANVNSTTMKQGAEYPVAYSAYYRTKSITVQGSENGVCRIANTNPNTFPASSGITTDGYKVGELISFTVAPKEGYVLRKVEYKEGSTTTELTPTSQGNYEFTMPDNSVTIIMSFVETGADVYSITYEDCEEVTYWSAYPAQAHFKGYDTTIPTPTRPNYDFAGWLVNGSTTPVMNLTLGGNTYSANITITAKWTPKATVRISLDAQNVVYNGAQQAFAVIGADASVSGVSVKYLINEKWTTKAPTASGVYSVRITRAEDATYQSIDTVTTFTIAKAPSSVIFENNISKVYNNAVVSNPIITTVGDGEITYHFFNSAGQEIAAPKAVGSYTVTVRMAEGVNYLAKEETLAFTISKATIDASTIAWSYSEPFVYSASAHSVYVEGVPSDVTVNYSGTRSATNAGTYTVSATFTYDEANYNPISIEPLEWIISKRTLTDIDLMWVYNEAFVYDMSMKEVTIDGLPEDVTVKEYIQNVAINAGTYTASAVFEFDSANYESVSISPLTWEIKKAKIDISSLEWTSTSLPFNGQLQSITLTGIPAGVEVLYSGNEYVVAGTYFATAIFFADEENFEHIRSVTTTWTIEKAETIISADIVNQFAADGAAHIPPASINHNEAELQFSMDAQTNPGTYWYVLSTPETNNYKAAKLTVKLMITQSDSGLISLALEENNKARSAKTLTSMYESVSQAYVCLSMVQDREANAFVDAYNEIMLTATIYNRNVKKATADMGNAYKLLFAPSYKLVPQAIVRELLDYILKIFE